MTQEKSQVYIAVPVSERLPESDDDNYFCICRNGYKAFGMRSAIEEECLDSFHKEDDVTHWLEPRSGYFLEREELKELLTKYADFIHHTFYSTSARDSNQEKFLSSLEPNTSSTGKIE